MGTFWLSEKVKCPLLPRHQSQPLLSLPVAFAALYGDTFSLSTRTARRVWTLRVALEKSHE
jgi:hypothetical protein